MKYVTMSGDAVQMPLEQDPVRYSPGYGWLLREDVVGAKDKITRDLLVLLGAVSASQFSVVACSWCSSILRIKPGGPGVTHSICPTCRESSFGTVPV